MKLPISLPRWLRWLPWRAHRFYRWLRPLTPAEIRAIVADACERSGPAIARLYESDRNAWRAFEFSVRDPLEQPWGRCHPRSMSVPLVMRPRK